MGVEGVVAFLLHRDTAHKPFIGEGEGHRLATDGILALTAAEREPRTGLALAHLADIDPPAP